MSEKKVSPNFACKFCKKSFTQRTNMYRHMKYVCSKNPHKKIVHKPELGGSSADPPNIPTVPIKTQVIPKVIPNKDIPNKDVPNKENPAPKEKKYEELAGLIKQQQEQINTLADIIKNKPSADTVNNTSTNTVIQNNNNIIYVTDQLDYLEILDKKFGGEKRKTIEFIKNKLHSKLQGEVDMFSAIHLSGPPNTWPIRCPDKSKKQFYLVQPDNSMVPDPGGVTTHKNFYGNLQNAVLKLINQELSKVIDRGVGSEEFETLRDSLLDDFDLQTFQNRALEMSHQKPGPFVKQLIEEMGHRENFA